MADWRGISEGINRGFQRGVATGGRLSQLGTTIKDVADRLRSQRETGEETGRAMDILGMKGLIEGTIEPTKEGGFQLPGVGRVKQVNSKEWQPKTKEEALSFEREKYGIKAESPLIKAEQARKNLTDSTKIREEFLNRPEVKEYVSLNTQMKMMDSAYSSWKKGNVKSANALDQILVNTLGRMVDPGATVREAEYERTPKNMSLANRFESSFNKLKQGGILNDAERESLIWGAKVIADERGNTFNQTLQEYKDLSSQYGIEENLITRGIKSHKPIMNSTVNMQLNDIVTIQDITGKTIQIPRNEAIKRGYING